MKKRYLTISLIFLCFVFIFPWLVLKTPSVQRRIKASIEAAVSENSPYELRIGSLESKLPFTLSTDSLEIYKKSDSQEHFPIKVCTLRSVTVLPLWVDLLFSKISLVYAQIGSLSIEKELLPNDFSLSSYDTIFPKNQIHIYSFSIFSSNIRSFFPFASQEKGIHDDSISLNGSAAWDPETKKLQSRLQGRAFVNDEPIFTADTKGMFAQEKWTTHLDVSFFNTTATSSLLPFKEAHYAFQIQGNTEHFSATNRSHPLFQGTWNFWAIRNTLFIEQIPCTFLSCAGSLHSTNDTIVINIKDITAHLEEEIPVPPNSSYLVGETIYAQNLPIKKTTIVPIETHIEATVTPSSDGIFSIDITSPKISTSMLVIEDFKAFFSWKKKSVPLQGTGSCSASFFLPQENKVLPFVFNTDWEINQEKADFTNTRCAMCSFTTTGNMRVLFFPSLQVTSSFAIEKQDFSLLGQLAFGNFQGQDSSTGTINFSLQEDQNHLVSETRAEKKMCAPFSLQLLGKYCKTKSWHFQIDECSGMSGEISFRNTSPINIDYGKEALYITPSSVSFTNGGTLSCQLQLDKDQVCGSYEAFRIPLEFLNAFTPPYTFFGHFTGHGELWGTKNNPAFASWLTFSDCTWWNREKSTGAPLTCYAQVVSANHMLRLKGSIQGFEKEKPLSWEFALPWTFSFSPVSFSINSSAQFNGSLEGDIELSPAFFADWIGYDATIEGLVSASLQMNGICHFPRFSGDIFKEVQVFGKLFFVKGIFIIGKKPFTIKEGMIDFNGDLWKKSHLNIVAIHDLAPENAPLLFQGSLEKLFLQWKYNY